jgi:hypothetical protein
MLLGAPGEIFSAEVRNALADDDEYEDMVNKHMSPIPPAFVDGFIPSAWDSGYGASNKPDMIDIWQRFNLARNDWDTLTVDDLLTADVNAHVNKVYGNTWDSDFEDDAAQLLNNKTKSIVALSHVADNPATFADLEARRRQIAANLIDYSDSDDEPTSDILPADWAKDNVPEYTGNERTLYIDRMGVALNPDISITSSGNNIGIQCTIEKSIMAGLVDMYGIGADDDAEYEAVVEFGDSTKPMVNITLNGPLTVYYTCTYQYYQIFMGWRDAVFGTPDDPEEYEDLLGTALLNVDWEADLPASVTIPFQVGDGDYRAAAVAAKEEYAPTVPLDLLYLDVTSRIIREKRHVPMNVNIQVVGVKMAFDVDIDVPVDAVTLKRNGENVDFAYTGIRFQGDGTIVFDPTQPENSYRQSLPFIQAAYGFADFGKVKNLNVDGYLSMDDGSFVTTHKIGYEDSDRYRTGTASCDSFLFLSPSNHSEIQVNGDTNKSHVLIKSNESLKVPIIYQYRMEDYNGHIFGDKRYKSTDTVVKNTKYANIIGIDIWLNTMSDTPKQYDIVVYSTYNKDTSISIGTITKKLQ